MKCASSLLERWCVTAPTSDVASRCGDFCVMWVVFSWHMCWVLFWVTGFVAIFCQKWTTKSRTEELARKDCWQTRRFRFSAHWTTQHLFKDYTFQYPTLKTTKPENQKHAKYQTGSRNCQSRGTSSQLSHLHKSFEDFNEFNVVPHDVFHHWWVCHVCCRLQRAADGSCLSWAERISTKGKLRFPQKNSFWTKERGKKP